MKGSASTPLPPDRLRDLNQQFDTLTKRFDAFMERRKADPEDEEEDDDDLREPAEEALRNSPGSDLANPDLDEPWYGH
jgi:hypothetical protein